MGEPDDFPVYAGSAQPPRPAQAGHVLGLASGVQIRTESQTNGQHAHTVTVLGFRLQPAGGGAPVEVELRGASLSGMVRDGDWIEIPQPRGAGLVSVRQVTNVSANAGVVASPRPQQPGARPLTVVVALLFFAIVVLVMLLMVFMRP